jgi:hypothetical protein
MKAAHSAGPDPHLVADEPMHAIGPNVTGSLPQPVQLFYKKLSNTLSKKRN